MSLYRQLWIAIAVLMLVVFGATFIINGLSNSAYLGDQLTIKNNDDASALALSLSQQKLDEVALELQLAALMDQGGYAFIEFRRADGSVVFKRKRDFDGEAVPGFLKRLFPIRSTPGSAQVSNGWMQLGRITLTSEEGFAYAELWSLGKRTLVALLIAILAAGAVGSALLHVILRPLDRVVTQARALGSRRFEKQPVPRTRELAAVTTAMNSLSDRVETMLREEGQRLSGQRKRLEADTVTGLLARDPWLERLQSRLSDESAAAAGSIALLRIEDLMALNRELGRTVVDKVLAEIGAGLTAWTKESPGLQIGRLNGSDFAVLAPEQDDFQQLGDALKRRIAEILARHGLLGDTSLPAACGPYAAGDQPGPLLGKLDHAMGLDSGDPDGPASAAPEDSESIESGRDQAEDWGHRLADALENRRLELEYFPVRKPGGELLHREGMLRLAADGRRFTGAAVLPWAHRLGRTADIDRAVVTLALDAAMASDAALCINLSSAALADDAFAGWLGQALSGAGDAARLLSFDITEGAAFDYPSQFGALQRAAHAAGAHVGIEHMGYRLADLGLLGQLGPDYLKVDRVFVQGIDINGARRALLTTYASIARNLGVPCIAEGIVSDGERSAAIECGVTGVTGPGID